MKKSILTIISLLFFGNAFAQEDTDINFNFGLESYFLYDFNQPANKELPSFLYSHTRHNEITINTLYLKGSYNSERIRSAGALIYGDYQSRNYSAEPISFQNLFEARVGYMPLNNLWIDAGIFASHIGFESTLNYENWTLTHSIVAHNSPFYESGVKVTYTTDQWLLSFLVLNGWQVIKENDNNNKGIGTQVQFKPKENILINSSTYFGEGYNQPDSSSATRIFQDFYCSSDWNDQLSSTITFDCGWQKFISDDRFHFWWGTSFITKYILTSQLSLAGRIEYYSDPDNVIISFAPDFKTFGYSLNLDFKPVSSILLRVEGKIFNSSEAIYIKDGQFRNSESIITFSGSFIL
jgi:hypothetical protein